MFSRSGIDHSCLNTCDCGRNDKGLYTEPMDFLYVRPSRQLLALAACISLLVHVIVLLLPVSSPQASKPQERMSVRLAPNKASKSAPQVTVAPVAAADVIRSPVPRLAAPRLRKTPPTQNKTALTSPEPAPLAVEEPKYTQAQRDDINNFLDSLGPDPKRRPNPQATLSGRSMAAARDIGRELAQRADDGMLSIERVPNSPPVDRFSLDFYLDALLSKLNRNVQFMKRPEDKDLQTASVQLRINPDGTVKSIEVLNEGDHKTGVEFIEHLLERSAPYSPFPPALVVSAKSLAIIICIKPGQDGDPGFSRFERSEGRGC